LTTMPSHSLTLRNAPTRAFVTLCDPIITVTRLRSVTVFGLGCRKPVTIRNIESTVPQTRPSNSRIHPPT
jgi:hypothetical protein